MKRNAILTLSLILLAGITLSGCNSIGGDNPLSSTDTSEVLTIKKLQIKTPANKLEYEVGEAFSSTGLKVELVETLNNKVISTQEITDYKMTYNEGQEIQDGTILEEGTYEIMISSPIKGVRSTSFEINVRVTEVVDNLYSIVKKMVDTNNYTVNNDVGNNNHVVGLMTEDALLWDATEEAYFMDEDFGYGTYNGKTFRYNLVDNQIKNAIYLTDLGGNAEDHGLFSIDTVDNMAERRISNYNIKGITDEDLIYLKDEVTPTSDNPNRYQIDVHHSKWLFNAIGHTQLTINPVYFLTSGMTNGKIFIEVKDYGLDVDLITQNTIDGVKGCKASITNIGKTVIPGMDEFLKNPTFGKKETSIDLLQKLLNSNHYQFLFEDELRDVVFTKDYVYGDYLKDRNKNSITLKANNKLNKEAGNYQLIANENNFEVGEKITKTSYLNTFGLFKDLNDYFIQDEVMLNKYVYKLNAISEQTSGLTRFLQTFTNYQTEAIDNVSLDLTLAGQEIYQVVININTVDNIFDSITLTNFNKASNEALDAYIAALY